MGIYARETDVSVEKSRSEIENTLRRYGAESFAYATDNRTSMIKFKANNRFLRFILPLPDPRDTQFTHMYKGKVRRTPDAAAAIWERACRQCWRALALTIKAKLEAVESGIAEFEDEFMSYIMLPGGKTVGEVMKDQIETSYQTGKMPPLLDYKGK